MRINKYIKINYLGILPRIDGSLLEIAMLSGRLQRKFLPFCTQVQEISFSLFWLRLTQFPHMDEPTYMTFS